MAWRGSIKRTVSNRLGRSARIHQDNKVAQGEGYRTVPERIRVPSRINRIGNGAGIPGLIPLVARSASKNGLSGHVTESVVTDELRVSGDRTDY